MAKKSFYKIEMLFLKFRKRRLLRIPTNTIHTRYHKRTNQKLQKVPCIQFFYKLQDQGYISDSAKVKVGKRQTRVYYHLEPAGKEYLSQLTHDYYQMVNYPSHAVQ